MNIYFFNFEEVIIVQILRKPMGSGVIHKMKQGDTIKVALVDGSSLYKEGLRIVLKRSSKIKTVGESKLDSSLLKFILQKRADILLIDLISIDSKKLKLLTDIIQYHPEIKVVVLSANTTNAFVSELLDAGVHGFINKESNDNVINAIKQVHSGTHYFSETIVTKIERRLSSIDTYCQQESVPTFNHTEKAIIECICQEMTNKEIADKLFLSTRTVDGYKGKILQKIKAKGTVGIVIHAIRKGLCNLNP